MEILAMAPVLMCLGVSNQPLQFEKLTLTYWNNFVSSLMCYMLTCGKKFNTFEVRLYKTKRHTYVSLGGITTENEGLGDVYRLREDGSFEKKLPEEAFTPGEKMEEMKIFNERATMITRMIGYPSLH